MISYSAGSLSICWSKLSDSLICKSPQRNLLRVKYMSERRLPSVGFDRFVTLEWMNYALDLALMGKSPEAMHEWLSSHVSGHDALRKTNNLLTNLWLAPYPETQHLRQQGIDLAQQVPFGDRLILHWGMALANFALFRTTVQVMGRLLRLQGDFQSQEIIARVLELYSNTSTVGRVVSRIIQSVAAWGVISNGDGRYRQATLHEVHNPSLVEWVLKVALFADDRHHWVLVDLLRTNELFPFDLTKHGRLILHRSDDFMVSREGLDREVVALANRPVYVRRD